MIRKIKEYIHNLTKPQTEEYSQYKINTYLTKTTSGYHVIDGKWVRLDQVINKNNIYYYTDGVKENISVKNGKIINC